MIVTFKTYGGEEMSINSDAVQSVSTYQHFDHDLELPDEMYHMNRDGNREVDPAKREEADALRTSARTILQTGNGSFIVRGTREEVLKALAAKK